MTDTNIREHQVIEHLRSLVEAKTLWGFSLAFVNERKTFLSYDGVMGQIPPHDRLPVKAGLCYDLASLSKVVGTASRIMQLVAEGIEECSKDTQSLVALSEKQSEETLKFKL